MFTDPLAREIKNWADQVLANMTREELLRLLAESNPRKEQNEIVGSVTDWCLPEYLGGGSYEYRLAA